MSGSCLSQLPVGGVPCVPRCPRLGCGWVQAVGYMCCTGMSPADGLYPCAWTGSPSSGSAPLGVLLVLGFAPSQRAQTRRRQWPGLVWGTESQSPSEPSAAQHPLKPLIFQALLRDRFFGGVNLESQWLLSTARLQLPPCLFPPPTCLHWGSIWGWDAEGGDAGCLLTLS